MGSVWPWSVNLPCDRKRRAAYRYRYATSRQIPNRYLVLLLSLIPGVTSANATSRVPSPDMPLLSRLPAPSQTGIYVSLTPWRLALFSPRATRTPQVPPEAAPAQDVVAPPAPMLGAIPPFDLVST